MERKSHLPLAPLCFSVFRGGTTLLKLIRPLEILLGASVRARIRTQHWTHTLAQQSVAGTKEEPPLPPPPPPPPATIARGGAAASASVVRGWGGTAAPSPIQGKSAVCPTISIPRNRWRLRLSPLSHTCRH
jgi:hypothetical protein